jgi:hypothetical protein
MFGIPPIDAHIPPMVRVAPPFPPARTSWLTFAAAGALALASVTGCGSAPPPQAADASADQAEPAAADTASDLPPVAAPSGQLSRTEVDAVLKQGPPWLLQRVRIEEVIQEGKFIGWRVLDMPPEWNGLEIKPGDVITRVNGVAIERPDDLWTAWTTLAVASDLRVHYERDGATHEMLMPITGVPVSETRAALERAPDQPAGAPMGPPRKTIVIGGDD